MRCRNYYRQIIIASETLVVNWRKDYEFVAEWYTVLIFLKDYF